MRIHGYDFDCPSFPDRLFLSYLSLILPRLPSCPLAFPSHPHRIISLFRHIHTPAKVRRHLHTESSNSRPAQASADTSMHTPRYRLPQKADWMKGYRLQGNWDEWKADGRRSWCACKSIFPRVHSPAVPVSTPSVNSLCPEKCMHAKETCYTRAWHIIQTLPLPRRTSPQWGNLAPKGRPRGGASSKAI